MAEVNNLTVNGNVQVNGIVYSGSTMQLLEEGNLGTGSYEIATYTTSLKLPEDDQGIYLFMSRSGNSTTGVYMSFGLFTMRTTDLNVSWMISSDISSFTRNSDGTLTITFVGPYGTKFRIYRLK